MAEAFSSYNTQQITQESPSVHSSFTPEPYNLKREVDSLSGVLNKLFPENRGEDKELFKAKEILAEKGKQLTQEQIKDTIVEVQYLVECWIDEYERQIFKGETLNELLSSKQL